MNDSEKTQLSATPIIPGEVHLRLFDVSSRKIEKGHWNTSHVKSPFWRLYANERDGMEIELHDFPSHERFALRGGRVYLVPSGVHFSCHNFAAVEHFYIHFDLLASPLLRTNRLDLQRPLEMPAEISATKLQRWPACIREIAGLSRIESEEFFDVRVDFTLGLRAKALIYEVLSRVLSPSDLEENDDVRAVRPALERLEVRPGESVRNDELASLCGFCPDHFIVRFRRATGVSPGRYALERRLGEAAQQLLFTSRGIEEIACNLGFCDRFHFSRAFTKRFGASPAAYRKTRPV